MFAFHARQNTFAVSHPLGRVYQSEYRLASVVPSGNDDLLPSGNEIIASLNLPQNTISALRHQLANILSRRC